MKLIKNLNEVGALHLSAFLGVVVVLAVGLVGYNVLNVSHANPASKNTTTGTDLYMYKDASMINLQNSTTTVKDTIAMVGGISASNVDVLQVAPGGSFSYGGLGYAIPNAPALLSGKTCYSLRPVGGAGQVVIANISGGTQTFTLKAAPTSDETSYWQYVCVPYTSVIKPSVDYSVKNTGTTPVNVYREDIFGTYKY